jgi:hypothetical protein
MFTCMEFMWMLEYLMHMVVGFWKYSSLCVQSELNKGVLEHFVVAGWNGCLIGESALRMGKSSHLGRDW